MEQLSPFFMIAIMFAVMYFFMIRPENKRKKEAQAMRESLKKGDVITSMGGIIGKIVYVKPNTIIIETSEDRVRMELTKWAVSSVGVQTTEQAETMERPDAIEEKAEDKPVMKLNGEEITDGKK